MRLEGEKGGRVVRWQDEKGGRVVHRTLKTTEKRIHIHSSRETISDRLKLNSALLSIRPLIYVLVGSPKTLCT